MATSRFRHDDATLLLVQAAQAGDDGAANLLLTRYRDRLLQIVSLLLARHRTGLLEDEEDIVQDTLLKAFRSLGTFTPQAEGALLHWLARIAENSIRDALKRERSQKRGDRRERPSSELSSAFLMNAVCAGRESSPSQAAWNNELVSHVEGCVIALPEWQRRAFVIRQLCGLSFAEIARELGLTGESSARKLYSRAMTSVSTRLPDVLLGEAGPSE